MKVLDVSMSVIFKELASRILGLNQNRLHPFDPKERAPNLASSNSLIYLKTIWRDQLFNFGQGP